MLCALLLAASVAAPSGQAIEIVSRQRRSFDARPLDLEFLGDDRLLALSSDALALYSLDAAGGVALLSRVALPGPFLKVRAPAGLIRASDADASCWVLTNQLPEALLFAIEGASLLLRDRASALPWPGAPAGLRYVAGTNVLERGDERLARVAEAGWAVMEDGTLKQEAASGITRVGNALAPLWERFAIASSPLPPGQPDALLVLERGAEGVEIVETLPLEGSLRALAAHVVGRRARVVAAFESGETGLLVLELRAGEP